MTFIENGEIAKKTFETCPDHYRRKRRSVDYDNLYGDDGDQEQSHEYDIGEEDYSDELSDDYIDQHYDELEEKYDAYRAEKDAKRNSSQHIVAGHRRVHNGEEGIFPFFVAIRTSTNVHFCGGACKKQMILGVIDDL